MNLFIVFFNYAYIFPKSNRILLCQCVNKWATDWPTDRSAARQRNSCPLTSRHLVIWARTYSPLFYARTHTRLSDAIASNDKNDDDDWLKSNTSTSARENAKRKPMHQQQRMERWFNDHKLKPLY